MNSQEVKPRADRSGVIDLVAGPFAAMISAIWSGDRIKDYLTASDQRRQVWHTCLASEGGSFSPERNDIDFLYSRLTSGRAKDLIVAAYGCHPRGITGVLGRLGPRARSPEVYQLLVEAMERGGHGAKVLMHADEPSDQLIETMALLPTEMNWHALDGLMNSSQFEVPESLAMFVWTVSRLRKLNPDQEIETLMKAPQPIPALLGHLIRQPLPAPPWQGDNRLHPVTTGPDLLQLGDRFNNCLGEDKLGEAEILGVLNGTKYLYEWTGGEMAAIELVRVADIGWYVSGAKGIKNAEISRATRRQIAEAFSAAPNICATRLTIRSNIYPCSHFWGEIVCRALMP